VKDKAKEVGKALHFATGFRGGLNLKTTGIKRMIDPLGVKLLSGGK
jgi:hypothetical protein